MSEEIMERIKKLQELASRGVGGEKVNARIMLERAMIKYGVTESDLSSEQKHKMFVKYSGRWQRRLLIQIFCYVLGSEAKIYTVNKIKNTVISEVTPSQRIEVELLFDAHKIAFKREQEILFRAYINQNNLFSQDNEPIEKKYTEEEINELAKMVQMMQGIDRVHVRKQIGGQS